MSKQSTYDAEVSPLMAQIIAICKRAGIACLCTFDLGASEDEVGLSCTTCLPDGDGVFPDHIKRALDVVKPRSRLYAITITRTKAAAKGGGE